ncbi:FAD/NAD(P)-binding protein [Arenibacter latericius]|uniref:FAD/NAD(P)-binding protein n=1 Tax=Arenibacter latericius TaxID=86104 RepID=UPI00041E7053|nr:FAD/NAD(P)-binding protein [Arenibacter latericius]
MVEQNTTTIGKESPLTIGIIGFGPKGLYGLEQLLAHIANSGTTTPIAIHLFNRTGYFGSGDIYRQDQPKYLIMNYANHKINFNTINEPKVPHLVIDNYVQWLSINQEKPKSKICNLFSSRATVGKYLSHCFNELCRHLPNNVKLTTHVQTITNIHRYKNGYILKSSENESQLSNINFHKLLITTGHYSYQTGMASQQKRMTGFINFVYPVHKQLGDISPHSKVAIKGMGLTFIDTALSLTEGRGGVFNELPNGCLKYIPSGKEPQKIYPFSRTGLPMVPRKGDQDILVISPEVIKSILNPGSIIRPCSFEETILPKIKQLFHIAYYTTMLNENGLELVLEEDFSKIEEQVENFHLQHPNLPKFSWEYIENPFNNFPYPTHEYNSYYHRHLIKEAELGLKKSPLMSAVSTWRQISPIFNQIYSFGGLDAPSQQLFDSYYFGLFNRLAYGPPLLNAKKILALQKVGIIDLTFAKNSKCNFETDSQSHVLKQPHKKEIVQYLINATIPRAIGIKNQKGLFNNMLEGGIIRNYTNNTNGCYSPGYIDLDIQGSPYSKDGEVNKDIAFYGTPTEGITFDNDTLSRERNNFAASWAKNIITEIKLKQDSPKKIKTNEVF